MTTPDPFEQYYNRLRGVLQPVWDESKKVIQEAYEAGRIAGRNEAMVELRDRVTGAVQAALLGQPTLPIPPPPGLETAEEERQRAARGTVRPAVLAALRMFPKGARPAEIAAASGLNENSVRGALNIMDGLQTEKRGDLWFLAASEMKAGAQGPG